MIQPIDLRRETAITLADVAHHVPKRRGGKIHYSTIFRWVTKGVRGRVLQSIMIGGVRYTTVEALERFLNAPTSARPCAAPLDELSAINQALDQAGL